MRALDAWSEARFLELVCGRRWGKSKFLRLLGCAEAIEPQTLTWVVAPTYELTKRVYRPLRFALKHILPRELARRGMRCPRIVRDVDSSSERILELSNGSVVQAKSAENPDSCLGEGVTLILPDESARMKRELWEQYLLPTLLDVDGRACLATTPQGYDWNYENFLKGQPGTGHDPEWRSIQSPTRENSTLPPQVEEVLRRNMSEYSAAQELDAQFTARTGRCFPEFSREHNVRHVPIEPRWPIKLAVDFGYRTFACLGVQNEPTTATLRVFADAEWHNLTTPAAIAKIKSTFPWWKLIERIDCDPAGEGTNVDTGRTQIQLLREAFPGAKVTHPRSAEARSPKIRAQWLCDRLLTCMGERRLFVDESCTGTIRMFEQSTYPEHKDGQAEKDEPLKDGINDHLRDALGYHEADEYHERRAAFVAG